jgi:NDP-sugar pyrophosphorylase family protein
LLPLPAPSRARPQIANHSKVEKAIVGWESQIGAWSRVEGHSVLGKDVQVKVRGARVGGGRGFFLGTRRRGLGPGL